MGPIQYFIRDLQPIGEDLISDDDLEPRRLRHHRSDFRLILAISDVACAELESSSVGSALDYLLTDYLIGDSHACRLGLLSNPVLLRSVRILRMGNKPIGETREYMLTPL